MEKFIALSLTTALFTCLAIQSVTASTAMVESSDSLVIELSDTAGF